MSLTNLYLNNIQCTNGSFGSLSIQSFSSTSVQITSQTVTNLFSTNITNTNLVNTNITGTSNTFTNLTCTTNGSVTNLASTSGTVGNIRITSTTNSTSSTTGSVIISGGMGISCTTNSTSITNGGALTIAGGLSVAKTIYTNTLVNGYQNRTTLPMTINSTYQSYAGTLPNSFTTIFNCTSKGIYTMTALIGDADSLTIRNMMCIIGYTNVSGASVFWVNPTSQPSYFNVSGSEIQLKDPGAYSTCSIAVVAAIP